MVSNELLVEQALLNYEMFVLNLLSTYLFLEPLLALMALSGALLLGFHFFLLCKITACTVMSGLQPISDVLRRVCLTLQLWLCRSTLCHRTLAFLLTASLATFADLWCGGGRDILPAPSHYC